MNAEIASEKEFKHALIRDFEGFGWRVYDATSACGGISDLIVQTAERQGRVLFLELKYGNGKLRPSQRAFADMFLDFYLVARYVNKPFVAECHPAGASGVPEIVFGNRWPKVANEKTRFGAITHAWMCLADGGGLWDAEKVLDNAAITDWNPALKTPKRA